MFRKTLVGLSILSASIGASQALAYESGDFILRGGTANVSPNATSGVIFVTEPAAAAGNTRVGDVDVDDNTQFGFTLTYMYNENFGIELLAATPFDHDISLDLLNADIASTKHLPPTVTFNYHLLGAGSDFQPYVGAGINYTVFFDEKVTPALDDPAVFGTLASASTFGAVPVSAVTSTANTKIDLEDSMGLAVHLGFDYAITESLGINASYWWIDIDTKAEITTDSNLGQIKAEVEVDIDPSVYMLGLSYKF